MSAPIRELRAIAHRRSLGVLATTLVIVGCARSPALQSQAPATSAAVSPSTSATPATSRPSVSPSSGPSPTPLPSLAFEPPADILPPFSVTTVAVDSLRIREEPRLSAAVVATAGKGELVYIRSYDGPVVADGVDWYPVAFVAGYREWPVLPATWMPGWAGGGSGGQPYLELLPPRCPEGSPDLAMLAGMSAWERLACLGDRPVTIEGTYGCGGCGGTTGGEFEPMWLAYPNRLALLWVEWRTGGPLTLSFEPASGLVPPPDGAVVEVTGHFSDPASATCTMTRYDLDRAFPVEAALAELYCREQFVVDSYKVNGTDPKYPGA